MYKFERYHQLGLADFIQPLEFKMNPENRYSCKATPYDTWITYDPGIVWLFSRFKQYENMLVFIQNKSYDKLIPAAATPNETL